MRSIAVASWSSGTVRESRTYPSPPAPFLRPLVQLGTQPVEQLVQHFREGAPRLVRGLPQRISKAASCPGSYGSEIRLRRASGLGL